MLLAANRATARSTAQSSATAFLVYFYHSSLCQIFYTSIGSESALLQCPWEHCLLHIADVVVVQEESLVRQGNGSELAQSTAPCILRMDSRRLGAAEAAPRTAEEA